MYSRAYLAFKTEEFVAKFSREYSGTVAVYSKIKQVCLFLTCLVFSMPGAHNIAITQGIESQAVVEFAPYQKLPLEKKR